ncbi:MAG: hypothetical protein K5695_08975 [Oscillospiraceae bacterium]|nr:hypothetical protein [Oscillospiraceae bacterium]
MKKVISALTVAAMCASMAASAIPAFAVYKTGDVSSYLKVISASKGTISADGTTVTFDSAADAASAKLTVAQYLVADTANPSIQQIGGLYTTNSTSIKLGNNGQGVDYGATFAEQQVTADAAPYDAAPVTFTTTSYVNCFGYYTDLLETYTVGNGNVSWAHSSKWQGDGWVGNGKNDVLLLQWASDFGDNIGHDEDYTTTHHFLTKKSDQYPFTQFDVNLDASIADGTYTVDFLESYTHPEYGVKKGNWINVDGKNVIDITDLKGITIKVGGGETPTETTEKPTDKPTEATDKPTEATEKPTENTPEGKDISSIKDWTWVVDDSVYDPATDKVATITVLSAGTDPGIFGYDFNITANGETLDKAGFTIVQITQGDAYKFTTFQPNKQNGHVGATETNDQVTADYKATAGTTVVKYVVQVPKTAKAGDKFKIEIIDPSCGNYNKESLAPKTLGGTLTIAGGEDTTDPTEETKAPTEATEETKAPTEETKAPTEETKTPPAPGSYLYGDVNEDGKVELVDVVKLNRYLTGLDATITATATVNANCFRAAGESDADTTANNLDGKDSMEILKALIGLVKTADLPTKA